MTALAIAAPNRQAYSETFVHQHVEGLPFEVHYLFGGNLPTRRSSGLHDAGHLFPGEDADPWIRVCAIADHLAAHRVRAVLAEFGPTGVEMMPACRLAGVPLVVHFHGYDAWRQDVLASYGRRYPALFEQAAALIGVSREMCAQLEALGAPAAKVHHVPYGVDLARFAGGDAAGTGPDFIAIGRQVDKKGHLPMLLAFAELLRQEPHCTLRIIGDGPLGDAGRALAQALGIAARVHWLGVLAPEAVARELRSARALVQFSHSPASGDREGTPVSVLEAMACGVPVIGSRHAGIVDALEDGRTGLLVPPLDVGALAQALLRLARDPALAGRLGRQAAALARERYGAGRYLAALARILHAAIGPAGPHPQSPT